MSRVLEGVASGFLMVKKNVSGRRTRRTHNPAFKARAVLGALREYKALAALGGKFELTAPHRGNWTRCAVRYGGTLHRQERRWQAARVKVVAASVMQPAAEYGCQPNAC